MEILSSSMEDGDCMGGLPDSLIHRIISFFPSTKDAIEIDSYKAWEPKWTRDFPILDFVPNEKLVIDSKHIPLFYLGPRLSLWIRFAVRKDVKELMLDCDGGIVYSLPQFLFNNSSLVKMKLSACNFMPKGKVNWKCLKSLELEDCKLDNQAVEHVLSGSPLLECLELYYCGFQGAVVVASEHLKTFIIEDFGKHCPLLEISCPNLENLKISGNFGSTSLKFMDLSSSLHTTLELYVLESDNISPEDYTYLVGETMKQIQHVKHFEIKLSRS